MFERICYISFTDVCNWHCEYCDFPSKIKNHVNLEKMKKQLKLIDENLGKDWIFSIEGGEIGTLPEKYLDYFFNFGLVQTYDLSTNGLFLEKYWNKYKQYIRKTYYHVKEDFNDGDTPEIKLYDIPNIFYVMVVHKNNLEIFEKLLDKYNNIMWNPQVLQPRKNNLDLFDRKYYEKIYNIIKNRTNINQSFIKRFKNLTESFTDEDLLNKRQFCANSMNKIVISLTNNNIQRCCISTSSSTVEINEETLSKLSKGISPYPSRDAVCENCLANSVFRDYTSRELKQIFINIVKGSK